MSNAKMLIILTNYNIKLQFRQGFYYAWIFVTIFYICILYFLPPNLKELALPIIMLSEPSPFAMIFTGAIVLMERNEKMFENLFITPLPIKTYIYSKMISIAIPATFCTLLICSLNSKFSLKLLLLIPAVSLTTFFFVVFGLIISASAKDIISFIGRIGIFGSVFVLTIL
ncbi:MAG: hypothetical protein GY760_20270, partial [Deltaproteobacteria bacterium]|nr:hypothetical protein [Deltaproteobacteria bacterium]